MTLFKKHQKLKAHREQYESSTSIKDKNLDNDGCIVRVKSHTGCKLKKYKF